MISARMLQLSGVVVDLLYRVDNIPRAGCEAMVHGFEVTAGGGFNAMFAAIRAGMRVDYGGPVGTGPFADIVMRALIANDIAILQDAQTDMDQGCCTVLIDNQGERTFIGGVGAEGVVTDRDMHRIDAAQYDWCLLSGYSLSFADSHAALGKWLHDTPDIRGLVFDPSPVIATLAKSALQAALSRATWISANAQEAFVLSGDTDPGQAAGLIAADTPPNGGAVVRDGANGCFLALSGQAASHIPGIAVKVVDTNGAGDSYTGSFIAALAQGQPPHEAAGFANAAAALSTTSYGPATAPDKSKVETVLQMPTRA